MKYRESQPLATSPKATDPTKKPKKTRKVKFGTTTVTKTKSREDGYVKKTTQVKTPSGTVSKTKKRKTAVKALKDVGNKVREISRASLKAKTERTTSKRKLQAERQALKMERIENAKKRKNARK
jgi:hypothetical protein